MADYKIVHSNGQLYLDLGPGTLDNKTGINLIGQNFHGYGELLANNFLALLEHQANSTPPNIPVPGQLWWDTTVNQLKVYTNTEWTIVGPNYTLNQAPTGVVATTVTDTFNVDHLVGLLQVNGSVIGIVNTDPSFILQNPISNILSVAKGITIRADSVLSGTAVNAANLGGVSVTSYVRNDIDVTLDGNVSMHGINGLTVGSNGTINIHSDSFGAQYISALSGQLTLSAGATSIKLDSLTGEILLSSDPTSLAAAATKNYVDNSITSLINGSTMPTLQALSASINNDHTYYLTTNNNLALKANISGANFTGTVTLASNPTTSLGAATKQYVDTSITSFNSTLHDLPNSLLANSTVQVGSTVISLGGSTNTLSGLTSVNSTTLTGTLTGNVIATIINASTISGVLTGNVTGDVTGNVKGDLTGKVTGDVTGNVKGDLTGKVTGDVTGNVTGDLTGNASTATNANKLGNISAASYAQLNSPGFVGTPTSPTPAASDNSTKIATTSFVQTKVASVIPEIIAASNGTTYTKSYNGTVLIEYMAVILQGGDSWMSWYFYLNGAVINSANWRVNYVVAANPTWSTTFVANGNFTVAIQADPAAAPYQIKITYY